MVTGLILTALVLRYADRFVCLCAGWTLCLQEEQMESLQSRARIWAMYFPPSYRNTNCDLRMCRLLWCVNALPKISRTQDMVNNAEYMKINFYF